MDTKGKPDASIIGGGIAGLTTGLALSAYGHDVAIYADEFSHIETASSAGLGHATPVGGGNIEPIGISEDPELQEMFGQSQEFYKLLASAPGTGVQENQFYLVTESGEALGLPYDMIGHHVVGIDEAETKDADYIPATDNGPVDGEMDVYNAFGASNHLLQVIADGLEEAGVEIVSQEVDLENAASELPGEVVINCAGINAPLVHENSIKNEMTPKLGHLLYVQSPDGFQDIDAVKDGVEYALVPDQTQNPNEEVGELYSFVRNGGPLEEQTIVLGGSKYEGEFSNGEMVFPGLQDAETVTVQGQEGLVEVPEEIVHLNNDIWDNMAGIQPISDGFNVTPVTGIRPVREEGPKIEVITTYEGDTVVDNWGYGSIGWTLAPAGAIQVAELLEEKGIISGSLLDPAEVVNPALETAAQLLEGQRH